MKQIKLLGLNFLLLSLISCGQTAKNNTDTKTEAGWKELNENNYSIQYPENWDIDKSGKLGSNLFIFSKQTSPDDQFRENVNFAIQNLQGQNINLDKYVEISEEQIKTIITNGNLIESKRMRDNKSEFHKIIFTGDQGIYKLKFEQYYWIQNENAYVLTLTCEQKQFDNYKLTGEKILNSFKLK